MTEHSREEERKDFLVKRQRVTVVPIYLVERVLFPNTISFFTVLSDSEEATGLRIAYEGEKLIGFLLTNENEDDIPPVYDVGTVARIKAKGSLSGKKLTFAATGVQRFRVIQFLQLDPYIAAEIELLEDQKTVPEDALLKVMVDEEGKDDSTILAEKTEKVLEAMAHTIKSSAEKMATLLREIAQEPEDLYTFLQNLQKIKEPGSVADVALAPRWLKVPTEKDRQKVLQELNVYERLKQVYDFLEAEISTLEVRKTLEIRTERRVREFKLREQLEAIQKELGIGNEAAKYREKAGTIRLPSAIQQEVFKTIDELALSDSSSPQYSHLTRWLDLVMELPWDISTEDDKDIQKAEQILDEDHYGLQKIKERVLEFLVVRQRKSNGHGPILCFIGPPGTGKTSIGRSIARAMGRKFIRVSLGGKDDEAHIRGHRRTYIDASPGIVIQEIKRAGSNNPVFMIDEIDKIGASAVRGNPSSALLEVLDPAQNYAFVDSFLNIPFDLSRVMFICTGNIAEKIPPPLRDRMEILEFPGYTKEEKLQIAKKYLVPHQLEENGLTPEELHFTDAALLSIISSYTREAGVRRLEQLIGSICRKTATQITKGKIEKLQVGKREVAKLLGAEPYPNVLQEKVLPPGVAMGLAVTQYGGIPLFVEAEVIEIDHTQAHGVQVETIEITGSVKEVMHESAIAARTFVASHLKTLGIPKEKSPLGNYLHFHIPEGAVPKDGPSAGLAFVIALVSSLKGIPVRSDIAMTGEITLRGRILAVGGIKEKLLAAKECGAKTVLVPKENEKNLSALPQSLKEALKKKEIRIILVSEILEAVAIAIPETEKEGPSPPLPT